MLALKSQFVSGFLSKAMASEGLIGMSFSVICFLQLEWSRIVKSKINRLIGSVSLLLVGLLACWLVDWSTTRASL